VVIGPYIRTGEKRETRGEGIIFERTPESMRFEGPFMGRGEALQQTAQSLIGFYGEGSAPHRYID